MPEFVQSTSAANQVVLLEIEIGRDSGGKYGSIGPHCPAWIRATGRIDEFNAAIVVADENHIPIPRKKVEILLDIAPKERRIIRPIFAVD
jgi:hypothetical protein